MFRIHFVGNGHHILAAQGIVGESIPCKWSNSNPAIIDGKWIIVDKRKRSATSDDCVRNDKQKNISRLEIALKTEGLFCDLSCTNSPSSNLDDSFVDSLIDSRSFVKKYVYHVFKQPLLSKI